MINNKRSFKVEKNKETHAKARQLFNCMTQEFKSEEELSVFAVTVAILSLAILRGIEGNEFVAGFLSSAIEDKAPIVIKPKKLN